MRSKLFRPKSALCFVPLLLSGCTQIFGYETPTLATDAADATFGTDTATDTFQQPLDDTGDVALGEGDSTVIPGDGGIDAVGDAPSSEVDATLVDVGDDAAPSDGGPVDCNSIEACGLPECRDAGGICDSVVSISGRVVSVDSIEPKPLSGVEVGLFLGQSGEVRATSSADGSFALPSFSRGVSIDLSLYSNDGTLALLSTSRISLPISTAGAVSLDLSYAPFSWLERTAVRCGLFATEAEARANRSFFAQNTHIVGMLLDATGRPVSGVANTDIRVTLQSGSTGHLNRHGLLSFDGIRKTTVCFLDRDSTSGTYEANPAATSSTSTGRFVMFGIRGPSTTIPLGGVDKVQVRSFGQEAVAVSTGNTGIVVLRPGESDPRPGDGGVGPDFETDVYPIFTKSGSGCAFCHYKPGDAGEGGIGWESSRPRGPERRKLSFDGPPDETYANLLAGEQNGCEKYPGTLDGGVAARVCLAHPDQSLVLRLPLPNKGPDESGHPPVFTLGTNQAAYITIREWIARGAQR